MAEWIYFIHAPRQDFAATLSDEERAVFADHYRRLVGLVREGVVVLAGPTLGPINTGIVILEAPDEQAARLIMDGDPVIARGIGTGELRSFELSLLRGRDG